jgi:ABC-type uncharacterized transport system permease subunit
VALVESAKQKVELQLAEATAEKQSLQQKLAALETEKQDTLAAAAAEKQALTGKFTTEAKRGKLSQQGSLLQRQLSRKC